MPGLALRTESTESARNLNLHATTAPAECCGCPSEGRCAAYCRDNYNSARRLLRGIPRSALRLRVKERLNSVSPISATHYLF